MTKQQIKMMELPAVIVLEYAEPDNTVSLSANLKAWVTGNNLTFRAPNANRRMRIEGYVVIKVADAYDVWVLKPLGRLADWKLVLNTNDLGCLTKALSYDESLAELLN